MSLTDQLKIITKHRLGDGVILVVFNALQLLTSIQFQLFRYKNANQINIRANQIENRLTCNANQL